MSTEYKIKITVFTPVYNRAYCVKDVFHSLCAQTFTDFEWLVINDGSTDNTDSVINSCIAEHKIKIRYYSQKNGGQHRALNRAIQEASGELLMIVDSDDSLSADALEKVVHYEKMIAGYQDYAGVSGLRFYKDGTVIGSKWPDNKCEYIDLTNIQRYKKNMLLGDKAEAYYTAVLKKYYPLPEFENENDVEKGVLWNRIAADGLKIRWFREKIYCCEYLSDGMSKNIETNYCKNFQGYTYYINEFIHYDIGFARKVKTTIVYCELARKKSMNVREIAEKINIPVFFAYLAYACSFVSPVRKLKKKRNSL